MTILSLLLLFEFHLEGIDEQAQTRYIRSITPLLSTRICIVKATLRSALSHLRLIKAREGTLVKIIHSEGTLVKIIHSEGTLIEVIDSKWSLPTDGLNTVVFYLISLVKLLFVESHSCLGESFPLKLSPVVILSHIFKEINLGLLVVSEELIQLSLLPYPSEIAMGTLEYISWISPALDNSLVIGSILLWFIWFIQWFVLGIAVEQTPAFIAVNPTYDVDYSSGRLDLYEFLISHSYILDLLIFYFFSQYSFCLGLLALYQSLICRREESIQSAFSRTSLVSCEKINQFLRQSQCLGGLVVSWQVQFHCYRTERRKR